MLLRYENVAQTVTYLLALIGLLGLLRSLIKEKPIGVDAAQIFTRVLLCASFIGGFLCYLSGKQKYLHFAVFLLLIPMAACGVQQMIDFVDNKKQKIRE